MGTFTAIVDGEEIQITSETLASLDAISSDSDQFHILQDGKSYQANVLNSNFNQKTITISVNGNPYTIKIEDEYDQLVKKMGLSATAAQKVGDIKAPMPGLILDILVESGQTIEKGTPLVILEAMKMENVLKAEGDGVIKSIEVEKSAAVEKGQILIIME